MSERKAGWYWVKHKDQDDWEPDYWLGSEWMCAELYSHDRIGPRIPDPDEPWQCVPVEPTEDMRKAATARVGPFISYACWDAMLDAAPKPGGE